MDSLNNNPSSSINVLWCWREHPDDMYRHEAQSIVGNPQDCLIRFERYESDGLEKAYQQNGSSCITVGGLTVDFSTMKMIGEGFDREVIRIVEVDTLCVAQFDGSDDDNSADPLFPYDTSLIQPIMAQDLSSDYNDQTATWCWRATPSQMSNHPASSVFGNSSACWIRYDDEANSVLERAYQQQSRMGNCVPLQGYTVDFATMIQTKINTGFEREVMRFEANNQSTAYIQNSSAVSWCWRETPSQMSNHSSNDILGDPSECWIRYDQFANDTLEQAYQQQNQSGTTSPMHGYTVDFTTMMQIKIATGFEREVLRLEGNNQFTGRNNDSGVTWCWQESPGHMDNHSANDIIGDPNDCWIRYIQSANDALEQAYQQQNQSGTFSPMSGYTVSFDSNPMLQTKNATGFQREVKRIDWNSRNSPFVEYYNGIKLSKQTCPYCRRSMKFPETMTTPFIYCCNCQRSVPRLVQYQKQYEFWKECRCCGFYSEVRDFSRTVEIYQSTDSGSYHDRTELWKVQNCCCRCAKKILFPWVFSPSSRHDELKGSREAHDISHANGIILKWSKWNIFKNLKLSKNTKLLTEAEETYLSYLKRRRHHAPDLNYGIYLARLLKKDYEGAGAALEELLQECGNHQPSIGALKKLMEHHSKFPVEDEKNAEKLRQLTDCHDLLMTNCLGYVCPPKKLVRCQMLVKVIWQRRDNVCAIM